MKAVFDLDDTICAHKRRDFDNALPVEKTVEKIRRLKQAGIYIVIYTARGQNSCRGDVALIKEKYESKITEWLNKNNVPFDELVFGKPLGDLYIDDKGISLQEFYDIAFEKMEGKSGSEVYRYGNVVNKKCHNSWEQAEWYEFAKEQGLNVPKIYSVVLDNITMEYIDGKIEVLNKATLNKMLSTIFWFKQIDDGSVFDVECLIQRLDEHLDAVGCEYRFNKLKTFLRNNKYLLAQSASFSHGDFSVSNCLLKDGCLYLIDPNQNKNYSSYLMDLAKLKFCINEGQKYINGNEFEIADVDYDYFMQFIYDNNIADIVRALEVTHWIRLLKYEKNDEKIKGILTNAIILEGTL